MIVDLHPNYIEKKGKKQYVVLPYSEFQKLEEALIDYEDLIDLRKAKANEKNKATKSLEEVKNDIELNYALDSR